MQCRSLNDDWLFAEGSLTMMGRFSQDGGSQVTVDLPHDAMIHRKRDPKTANAHQTGFYPGGTYTYVKWLSVPSELSEGVVILRFGGIADHARILINDTTVALSDNPYAEIMVDATPYLNFGEKNKITVEVSSVELSSRWYTGAGIYRDVDLLTAGPIHVVPNSTRFVTEAADESEAVVRVNAVVGNRSSASIDARVRVSLINAKGDTVAQDVQPLTLFFKSDQPISQRLTVHNPELWSDENPHLYTCRIEILQQDEQLDEETFVTGLRTISVDASHGLRVNGKTVKLRGSCIHHDNGVIGAATFRDAEWRRCRQLKDAGFNALRSSHHPMGRAMLDACDALGMYVIDELSDVWTQPKNPNDYANYFPLSWRQDVHMMVDKDFNHPCVIMYSNGNEIPESGTARGAELNRRISRAFKDLDNTRFTVGAINGLMAGASRMMEIVGGAAQSIGLDLKQLASAASQGGAAGKDSAGADSLNAMAAVMVGPLADAIATNSTLYSIIDEFASGTDVAGYNYLAALHEVEADRHPQRVVLGTETFPADIVHLWDIVSKHPNVIGDMTWTGYDYIGEAGCGVFHYDGASNFTAHWPDRLAGIGDIDILGNRKPISYLREAVYGLTDKPAIGVLRMDRAGKQASHTPWMWKDNIASWTWPGFEGQTASVDVYANADEVELLINGRSLGRKPVRCTFVATFDVPYEAGRLKAISYVAGCSVGETVLETAGPVVGLSMQVENAAGKEAGALQAGGRNLAFVTIRPVDGDGRINRREPVDVTVKVIGQGTLQGFGSADPSCEGNYDSTTWCTYDGAVMAVLRPGKETGRLTVTASAPGCPEVSEGIEIVPARV